MYINSYIIKPKSDVMNVYSMTNQAIAANVGERIEQLRLEHNLTQQQLADEIGISRVSYRKLMSGATKFENIIAVLRVFNQLETIETLFPQSTFSPMQQLKNQGRKRQRASKTKSTQVTDNNKDEGLDW